MVPVPAGTPDSALQRMIDAAAPGDTIGLSAGTYLLDSASLGKTALKISGKRALTILGQGPRTIIQLAASMDYAFEIVANDSAVTISSLAIRGAEPPAKTQMGVATQNGRNYTNIHDVRLTALDIGGVSVGIKVGADSAEAVYDHVVVAGNVVHDLVGVLAGSGYGIVNDNATHVVIRDNEIRNVARHSIYQAKARSGAPGNVVIQNNLIVNHGVLRGHTSPPGDAALVIARSQNVTAAHNVILDAHTVALSVEPDEEDDPPVQARNIFLIDNVFMGSHITSIWINVDTAAVTGWGNQFVRRSDTAFPNVGIGASPAAPQGAALPEPPFWAAMQAIGTDNGDRLFALRGDRLYLVRPSYGTMPDATWIVSSDTTNWSEVRGFASDGEEAYVAARGTLYQIRPYSSPQVWQVRAATTGWTGFQSMTASAGHLYVVAQRDDPDRSHVFSVSTASGQYTSDVNGWPQFPSQGMTAWHGAAYVMVNNCVARVDSTVAITWLSC